ncbi:MAG: glycosyl hydrolase-related protein [Mariniphaga sp.]
MKKLIIVIIALFILNNLSAQQKKIYLAPDDHTDYMWSSNEEGYKQAFLETLDYYIKLNDSTANESYPYQSKWNCDGSYWVYTYGQNRSKEQFARLVRQMKEGKITVPLNGLISLFGMVPFEATLRDMYYAGSLERKYGLKFDLVLSMEDQVLPLGLSSLWAGSGAKYTWRGVCACASKVTGLENRPHDIYWYKGLDDQKVLMKWYSVNPSMITNRKEYRYNLGNYLEASNQENAIIDCKALMSDIKRYPYNISAAFGKGGDDLKTLTNKFPKVARDGTESNYQVIVSNEVDFFRDFEKEYGAKLPSETISYGSTEWGNSVASLAEVSATVKRSIEKLRTAEGLYTLVALKDKKFAADLNEKREKAWIACGLYFEHDWTSDGPITRHQRAEWQRKIAWQLNSYVDTLYDLSLSRLGELVSKPNKNQESFFVYNPLSWSRTDYSDYLYNGTADITIVDKVTSKEILFQIITKQNKKYLRILATDVPSLGFKVFEIKKGKPTVKPEMAAKISDGVIENEYYKITFTTQGVFTSLIDKKNNNRECISPLNKLYANDLGSGNSKNPMNDCALMVENEGPVSVTLVAESYKPIKHISKITLFKNSERIEIENYITQNIGGTPAIYAFSFNLTNPDIWHEEAGAILNARPVSQGGHYAESICRLDWLAMNHFADITGNDQGMMLSNRDAYFMKPGNSTVEKLDFTTPQINVLAAGQVDKWLGIENQDGDSYFENFFALQPHTGIFNATNSMKFSMEHQNPLVAGKISGISNDYNSQFSMFTVSNPNAFVWTVKPAEEGIDKGIILRVWNMDNKDSDCTISSGLKIEAANQTSHVETDIEAITPVSGELKTNIGHNRIETFRVFLK